MHPPPAYTSSSLSLSSEKAPSPLTKKTGHLSAGHLVANHSLALWAKHLPGEVKAVREEMAFGIITSAATLGARAFLLRHWWVPGSAGCLYTDRGPALALEKKIPEGLELCFTPPDLRARSWYKDDARATVRGGIIALVIWRAFPGRQWYVIGDDDTMFSPLALAQWLGNFEPSEPWYMGTRSENIDQRRAIGWDMGFGGGGIVLSRGLLGQRAASFASSSEKAASSSTSVRRSSDLLRCFDDSQWNIAPGGDWILHRCMARLGFPLTVGAGMHQVDCSLPIHTKVRLTSHFVCVCVHFSCSLARALSLSIFLVVFQLIVDKSRIPIFALIRDRTYWSDIQWLHLCLCTIHRAYSSLLQASIIRRSFVA